VANDHRSIATLDEKLRRCARRVVWVEAVTSLHRSTLRQTNARASRRDRTMRSAPVSARRSAGIVSESLRVQNPTMMVAFGTVRPLD
jgi:hypothetical protein